MNRTARALTLTATALLLAACGSSEPAGHPGTRDLENRIDDVADSDCDWTHDVDYDEDYTITSCNDGEVVFAIAPKDDPGHKIRDARDRELRPQYDGDGCATIGKNYVGFARGDGADWLADSVGCTNLS